MKKILMVCLGNICRSPLAAGILASKNIVDITVDSAGTASYHIGESPDKRAIAVAKRHHIDIASQRARAFTPTDFKKFDTIYAMDQANYKDLLALAKNDEQAQKVKMILNELYPNENRGVPDPFFGQAEDFENVFTLLNRTCDAIVKKMITK